MFSTTLTINLYVNNTMKRLISLGFPSALLTLFLATPALALFTSVPVTEVTETQAYQYDVIVRSQPGDSLELKLIDGPKGMTLNSVNSLRWQTGYNDAGVYPILLEVSDGHNTQQQAYELTVHNKNQAPIITSSAINTIHENDLFSYTVKATDADNDKLRIEFLDTPKQIQVSGDTLTWQTDYQSAGEYPLHIRVRDNETYTDQIFVLTVKNVNRPPVFAAVDEASLRGKEDQPWQLAIAVSDPDGDKISLSLNNAPEGMTLEANTLRWRPSFQQAGDYTVQIIANDGQDKTTLKLPISIENVNRLPEFISQPTTTITETQLYRYDIRAYDPDETPLHYRLLAAPEGMSINSQNQLLWQTGYEDAGQYDVQIEVSDGEASIEQSFSLTVINKNRPVDIVSQPVTQINEAELFSYTFQAVDPDGDDITIDYATLPGQVTREGNVISWQTDYKSAGKYPFLIRASDAESTTEQSFVLEVVNVNHKPVISSKPSLSAIEAVAYQYTINATDADDEPLTFTLVTAPEGMKIRDNIVSWVPNFDQAGKHPIVIAVSDGIDTVTQTFTINVADTNREPTLMDIDNQTVIAGETFRYQLEATDVDGDEVSISLLRAPSAARLNRHAVLSWRTKTNDIGEHIFIIVASDGDLESRKHFRLNVIEKPSEP